MNVLDVEQLLQELSSEAPCGDDLEYDAAFGELERAAQGKAEQQFGDTVVAAEEPDWRDVKRQALELLGRTKDLRVATLLARAVLRTDGYSGFADALRVIRGWIDQFWEPLHPRLDPDDDNDPTLRVNTLVSLCDADATLRPLREAPLVSSRTVGRFTLKDLLIVHGEYPAPTDAPAPEKSAVDAAFMDVPLEELQQTMQAVQSAMEDLRGIEVSVTEKVGVANAAQLAPVVDMLRLSERYLQEPIASRSDIPAEAGAEGDGPAAANGQSQALSGEVRSREDVIRALDKICDYYERHEPSSPVPLLLKRAKRLASKSFMEIIRDLTPEGLNQALSIGGIQDGEQTF